MTTAGLIVRSESFHAPGPKDFNLPPIFSVGGLDVTKPMLLIILSAILVFTFFYLASRKAAVVPGKLQYFGEVSYNFARNDIARDSIGSKDFMRYVPYIVSLFFFVLVNNLFGIIPFIQFPSMSRISFVYGLTAITWFTYNIAGMIRHGAGGYLKRQSVPAGINGPILALIIPLEFVSNIIVRPVTLALRLFANMFAGHLLLILFTLGGQYLVMQSGNALHAPVGIIAWALAIAVSFLEILIEFLQAYVFALLTAMYIGGALAEEH